MLCTTGSRGTKLLLLLTIIGLHICGYVLGEAALEFEFSLIDPEGVANDELGLDGPVVSADSRHILTCAKQYASGRGKCVVFSKTYLADDDWNTTVVSLVDPYWGGTADGLGRGGAIFSQDSRHIVACAYGYSSDRGKCLVFSESNLGDQDWNTNALELIVPGGTSNERFGYSGAAISSDSKHIISCAFGYSGIGSLQGKCLVFSESNLGDQDWDANILVLLDPEGLPSERFGLYGPPYISPDSRYIVICSAAYDSYSGKCMVFFESNLGDEDWDANVVYVTDPSGGYIPSLGDLGAQMYNDSRVLVTASPNYDDFDGKVVVFCETSPGDHDWNNTRVDLIDPLIGGTGSWSRLGLGGVVVSADSQHIIACAPFWANSRGKCIVFSESNLGDQDWDANLMYLNGFTAMDAENSLGYGGAMISADSRHIISCGSMYGGVSGEGKCMLFTETNLGEKDWENNIARIYDNSGVGTSNRLGENGVVISPDLKYIVSCSYGYNSSQGKCMVATLQVQDTCVSDPCMNGGTCLTMSPFNTTFTCACVAGYTGDTCAVEIDECSPDPCVNAVSCTDELNGFLCTCLEGWTGAICAVDVDDCTSNPCQNGGTCADDGSEPNTFNCTCLQGWTGRLCDVDVDDCTSNPCQNGGTCADNGSEPNTFNCTCLERWTGRLCDVDDCTSSPCQNGGTCADDGSEPNTFNCTCLEGWTGRLCDVDVDDCTSNPCQNGGTCTDDGSEPHSFNCICDVAYEGILCDLDVDDCMSDPCFNNATCFDDGSEANSFNCSCLLGYNGTLCADDVNDCASHPCDHSGTSDCLDLGTNAFECECNIGYTGALCEVVPACMSNPCLNNGTCIGDEVGTGFQCSCTQGASGAFCEVDDDDCVSSPCQAEGTNACNDLGINSYECTCITGWSGSFCELADARTYEIQYVLADNQDVYEFSLALEKDIEVEYSGANVTVIPTVLENDVIVFRVTFLLDGQNVLPQQAELEVFVDSKNYEGTIIATATSNEQEEEEADTVVVNETLNYRWIIIFAAAIMIVVATICLVWRRKQRIRLTKDMFEVPN